MSHKVEGTGFILVCSRVRLLIDALWLPAGKGLTSWLSFMMYTCEVVTFQLVSWVMCGADLCPLSYFYQKRLGEERAGCLA